MGEQGRVEWGWESNRPPTLTSEQTAMLDTTIAEVRASPLSCEVKPTGGRSAVWRYLEAAQWRIEPVRGKRVSDFFLDTCTWRKAEGVDGILDTSGSFADEAASGKMFVTGTSLAGQPLIWVYPFRENNAADPEANIKLLIYTMERAIAGMGREALGPDSRGQFCVVIECSMTDGGGEMPSLAFVRGAVSMLMLRYPSRLRKLFLVNAGFTLYYLWQAVSLLLAPTTKEKVVVVSGTEEQRRQTLLAHISSEALKAGSVGCAGAPPFDVDNYLSGGSAIGMGGGGQDTDKESLFR